jgi:hypothetical protein
MVTLATPSIQMPSPAPPGRRIAFMVMLPAAPKLL